jgi:putative ABC transport system ATP-binding protein
MVPRSNAEGAQVALRGVHKRYGSIAAVRGVDLDVAKGEFIWITGRSGSGKSTLLNLIGGLEQPDSGEVLIDGEAVWRGRRMARHRRTLVGFVFQHDLLLPMLSAQANVEVPLIGAGVGRRERAQRARALLDEVSLADRADHRPDQLSGGERQRVAVARALVNEPRLLLADEPTGALDSATSERLLALLFSVRERHRMTVIMVSYDPLVGRHADRGLRMVDGTLEGESAAGADEAPSPAGGPQPVSPQRKPVAEGAGSSGLSGSPGDGSGRL